MDAWGYILDLSNGDTKIVLHNDFSNATPTQDLEEGDQMGTAKVTCAHELKHARSVSENRIENGEKK